MKKIKYKFFATFYENISNSEIPYWNLLRELVPAFRPLIQSPWLRDKVDPGIGLKVHKRENFLGSDF